MLNRLKNKGMKKVLALVSSILLMGGMQAYAADQTSNIAVVNVQQVFQQSPKIAELNKKLQSQFKGRLKLIRAFPLPSRRWELSSGLLGAILI